MLKNRPTRDELLELDYLQLQQFLAAICSEMLDILDVLPGLVAGFKEKKAEYDILKMLKSLVQSLLRAQNA